MAVFIDLENLFSGYSGTVHGVPITKIMNGIKAEVHALGHKRSAATTRAYANWTYEGMATYRRETIENGVEPIQVWSSEPYEKKRKDTPPTEPDADDGGDQQRRNRKKNAADIQLVVDALTVAQEAPWIDVFVIVTGDGDFIPLIRRLQFLGKFTIGVDTGYSGAGGISGDLRAAVDHFVSLPDEGLVPRLELEVTGGTTNGITRMSDIVPSDVVPDKAQYVTAVKSFTEQFPAVMKDGAVDGAFMSTLLRKKWPRASYKTYSYRSFGAFIEEGCGMQIFHPLTTAAAQAVRLPETVPGGERKAQLHAGLESVVPAVVYPTREAVKKVLEELTLQLTPMSENELLDFLGYQIPEVPAEQVRLAFNILITVGGYKRDAADGRLTLSSSIKTVQQGIDLIIDDAKRRADSMGWDVNRDELEDAIFNGAK
ncbi:NYN domain-containing protein [Arthrobacter sp. SAFR-179]|uniref:NYN domain-containing protein n=1 Tax=Arthrobacter sp. SAFR-179 TaxID=3387279 RepID=UPI003F7C4BA1